MIEGITSRLAHSPASAASGYVRSMADTDPTIDAGLTEFLHATMPFAGVLDIQAVSGDKDAVVAQVSWAAERCTSNDIIHGGYLMAVADTAGRACQRSRGAGI